MAGLDLGRLGEFAAVGAVQGVGAGMLHEHLLDEAYQMQHQNVQYDKELQDNKAKDDQATAASKDQQELTAGQKDRSGMVRADAQINQVMPPSVPGQEQQPPQPQQAPGATGPIQPRTASIGQGGTQVAQNQPQGAQAPNVQQAPPPSQVPPTSPSSQVVGKMDAAHTLSTQDPYDLAAHAVASGKDARTGQPAFSQNAHDDYMSLHAQYPGISPVGLAAAYNDWAPANGDAPKWDSYEKFTKHLADMDKAAQKEPISEEHLSLNEQNRYSVLKNNGDMPDEPVQVSPLSAADKNIRSKNAMVAQRVEQGSATALDSLLRQAGLQGKYDSGIGAGAIADFSNTVSSWFSAGQTDKAAATQQMGKETTDSMIALMRTLPPGTRQGAQMAKYELQGVADTTKGAEPNLQVINSMFGNSLMAGQSAYIQRTAGRYETQDQIDQLSARYSENNPPFLADGTTPNPNWMNAKDWINAGGPQGKNTEQGNLSTGRQNIDTKKNAAIAGQNPSEVGNKTSQSAPKTINFNDLPK